MQEKDSPLILIVEDSEDLRYIYSKYLEHFGYRTEVAADGAEAVRKAIRLRPAVIVMDMKMPGMDGAAVAKVLRAERMASGTRLIGVTGADLTSEETAAFREECHGFLVKPIEPGTILSEIERVLRLAPDETPPAGGQPFPRSQPSPRRSP